MRDAPPGRFFWNGLRGIQDRISVRQLTTNDRVDVAATTVSTKGQWIVWCGLNEEGRSVARAVPGSVLVEGTDSPERKAEAFQDFCDGNSRVLITKPRIGGFGLNFQNCHQMVFLGLSDSYEQYYQCIRRCWRFGQRKPVTAVIITSEPEEIIVSNVRRKERESEQTTKSMIAMMRESELEELGKRITRSTPMKSLRHESDLWTMILGDSCVELDADHWIQPDSIDFSIYSPPFSTLYSYTDRPEDLGNSKTNYEFFEHFQFIIEGLLRVTKPGRITACHVSQIPSMKIKEGFIGLRDFRGKVINAFMAAGWIHHGEVVIDKNPQSQAIRTKAKGLMFVQLRKDSSWLRPALADFLLLFRKPGENAIPIKPDITNEEWIKFAHPVWYDIRETDTLSSIEARDQKDEKHICPLQLGLIDRAIRIWSNEGETVLSPFAGIGSEGYQALLRRRRFIGVELKESYFRAAISNLRAASDKAKSENLFR